MKQSIIVLLLAVVTFSCGAQKGKKNSPKVQKLNSGSWIAFYVDTDSPVGKVGEMMYLNVINQIGDSVVYDSKMLMNGQPANIVIAEPQYNGDPMEIFTKIGAGDSVTYITSVDSFFRHGLPPFSKSGDSVKLTVQVVGIKTQAQVQAEQEAAAAQQIGIDQKTLSDYFKKNNISPLKTPGGVYYTIQKKGSGPNPQNGQQITVNYTGKGLDGKVFDSNVLPEFRHVEPFTFAVGTGQVIRGWDDAFSSFNAGTKATIYIPSTMAYGPNPPPGASFGPNACLIFDVDLISIK